MTEAGKIYGLIPKIMADVGAIGKGRTNSHQHYAFRGIEDMYNAVQPALIKHSVFCAPEVVHSQTFEYEREANKMSFRVILKVCHRFYADDGSHVDVTTVGEGIDTSDKASNKAMSAAMKYAFIELLSIPTEDIEDADRDTPEVGRQRIAPDQPTAKDGNRTPRHYTLGFGKWSGRTLEQLYNDEGPEQIASYIHYLETAAQKKGVTVAGQALEFIRAAESFLGAMEGRTGEPGMHG